MKNNYFRSRPPPLSPLLYFSPFYCFARSVCQPGARTVYYSRTPHVFPTPGLRTHHHAAHTRIARSLRSRAHSALLAHADASHGSTVKPHTLMLGIAASGSMLDLVVFSTRRCHDRFSRSRPVADAPRGTHKDAARLSAARSVVRRLAGASPVLHQEDLTQPRASTR